MLKDTNPDKKVLDEGRKEKLEGVDAPLRDQIVKKLFKTLKEMEVGAELIEDWHKAVENRAVWTERQKAYMDDWDSHLLSDTSGPFQGSSQLHIPLTFTVAKTLHARFLQALWGMDPPFYCKARNEASTTRVDTVKDTLRYALYDYANYNKGVEDVVDKWAWDWVTTGSGMMKWRWDCTYTRFTDVQTIPTPGAPRVGRNEQGQEVLVPTVILKEKEVKVTKETFNGPVLSLVDFEDFAMLGGGGDPDCADSVFHREFLTASQLWTLSDRKIFDSEAVEKVINAGPDREEGGVGGEVKAQRSATAGRGSPGEDQKSSRYEVVEIYFKKDIDGSGIVADLVAWVHVGSKEILRATYLHRISKDGSRPFVKADFHLRKNQEFGVGIVELLYPLATEMDAMHNMRVDFGLISTMPFGFYRPTSGIDPETIQYEPGTLIPVDDPQRDVFFPNMGNRTVFGMQEEAAIDQMVERLTGISGLSYGQLGGQGATRTATGARALVGEMNANLDVHLRRLNRGWKKCLRYGLHMLQQRIPNGLSFRLTGEDGQDYWRQIKTADDIAGDFDLEVSPNSASSNAAIQQEVAGQILQLTGNPLDIQLGIVTPAQRYEAVKNFYQSLGLKDYGRYVQKPNGYRYNPSPEEEANRVLRGVDVPVTPEMDHQGFIDYFDYIFKSDELLGQFNEEETKKLFVQKQKHEGMMKALAAQQAQAANAAQMQINAGMSQQQSSPGLSPFSGAMGAAPVPMAGE